MRTGRKWVSWFLVLALASPGCGGKKSTGGGFEYVRADVSRQEISTVGSGDFAEFVRREQSFSLALLSQRLQGSGGDNVALSPLSIWVALAMTYAGATGDTASQMADALRFTGLEDLVHRLMNALILALEDAADRGGQADENFVYRLVDSLWLHRYFSPARDFLDTLARYYGSGVFLVDYAGDPAGAVAAINRWVSEQTEGKIHNALCPDCVDGLTRLVLVNAVYFKASWHSPFDDLATMGRPFYLENGSEVTAQTMTLRADLPYAEVAGTEVMVLDYEGGAFSLVAVMPPKGTPMANFLSTLDAEALQSLVDAVSDEAVVLYFPKLHMDANVSMKDLLTSMGMADAFQHDDFLDLSANRVPLHIQNVYHQVFFDLDEAGTEAAAATEVVMNADAGVPDPEAKEVHFDHPFLFFLREREHGIILFLGLVRQP